VIFLILFHYLNGFQLYIHGTILEEAAFLR
jgi:hypothetical protein